jgi:peptide-methionine (S)-S-oxide reductase
MDDNGMAGSYEVTTHGDPHDASPDPTQLLWGVHGAIVATSAGTVNAIRNKIVEPSRNPRHRKGMLLLVAVLAALGLGTNVMSEPTSPKEIITVGGGCFWCTEAVFDQLKGVEKVESGYSGGSVTNPTYRQVCGGDTGHAEVIQITFDPQVISLQDILEVFFRIHNPTTLNRQGNDIGTQYRSVIFYRNAAQKAVAEQAISDITAAKIWDGNIVTEVTPFKTFYKAEAYHQDYFRLHGEQPYCQAVIAPKVSKFREHFRNKLKSK